MAICNKKGSKGDRKVVSVDITDFYEDLKNASTDDIRTIEEEIRYFIKKGLGKFTYNYVTYSYPSKPSDINCTKGSVKDNSLVYYGEIGHTAENDSKMIPINESSYTSAN